MSFYFDSAKERSSFYSRLGVQKICKDFQDRKPISFAMMARLIVERKVLCVSFRSLPPFNKPNLCSEILKKLASLKMKGD